MQLENWQRQANHLLQQRAIMAMTRNLKQASGTSMQASLMQEEVTMVAEMAQTAEMEESKVSLTMASE